MGIPGPQMVDRYGLEFKLTAVKMSESLCIHPFMLSKWRKQVRDGVLMGKTPKVDPDSVAELKRLHDVEKKYQRLQLEHDLLKKAIRFASDLKAKSSPSSRQTGKPTRST